MNRYHTESITGGSADKPVFAPTDKHDDPMGWEIDRRDSPDHVRVVLGGAFSLARIADLIADIVGQPFWRRGFAVLIDDRDLDTDDIRASDIEAVSNVMRYLNHEFGHSYMAILTGSEVQYGFARQFQIRSESNSSAVIRAFRIETEALDWLATALPMPNQ
ncbi:MAG: hypothetical protein ABI878_10205 [Acidobacteriota bacterium]